MSVHAAHAHVAQEPSARYLGGSAAQDERALTRAFDLLATAPGGVKHLRELILSLAVRGVLVDQSSSEEATTSLLATLQVERSRFVAAAQMKRDSSRAIDEDECIPCHLPTGWSWVRLSQLGEFRSGKTPSTGRADFWGGSVPWVSPKDMKSLVLSSTEDYVTDAAIQDGLSIIPRQSVLIVVRSGILRRMVPVAINAVPCTINQDLKALTLVLPSMAPYVQLMIRGFESFILANLTKVGTTVESMMFDAFAGQAFPFPPLAEQHRIVTRVEELMHLCDVLEAKGQLADAQHTRLVSKLFDALIRSQSPQELAEHWQRISAHFDLLLDHPEAIDALEQTILQLAVRGLLVPQDPSDEPASELLARIRKLRANQSSRSTGNGTSNVLAGAYPVPSGWNWIAVSDIADVGTGTTPSRGNPSYFDPPTIPWVTSGETGQPQVHATAQFVSPQALRETSLTLYPAGTLLVAMYGQGKTRGQVTELCIAATTNQACAAIVLIEQSPMHQQYVKLFFEKIYDEIREQSAGGAQPNLNVGKVKSTLLPLPPLAEQHRIVTRVQQLRALCTQLRERLHTARATQARLAQTLVEQATMV